MMSNFENLDKAAQKTRLTMEFTRRIAPLTELAESDTAPTPAQYYRAVAQVRAGSDRFQERVATFASFGDVYIADVPRGIYEAINGVLGLYSNSLNVHLPPDELHAQFKSHYEYVIAQFTQWLDIVPVDWQARLYEANTPFTVSMRIQDAVASAHTRVDYVDRYLRQDFFQLYLRLLPRTLAIRLVTTHGQANKDFGVLAVSAVSLLASQEFTDYQLIERPPADFHGRMLRVDDLIFTLDASLSDAGKYPTHFGPGDSSLQAHQTLDAIIQNGTVIHSS